MTRYAEIGVTTNFSFLRGASHPQDYVHQASELRIPVIGIADQNTLSGVVRAYKELENKDIKNPPRLLIGSRLVFSDGAPDILVYPKDREAYGRLCRLLTVGKLRAGKGECQLELQDLLDFSDGQFLVVMPPYRLQAARLRHALDVLKDSKAGGLWLAANLLYRGSDRRRLARLANIADTARVPLLATNDVLYHHPDQRPLQDVLTCIREKTTINLVGRKLEAHAERHLKPPEEMSRLFRMMPGAIAETMRFAERINFKLDDLKYHYPDEPVPQGKTAQRHLEDLTWSGAHQYFPIRIPPKVKKTLHKELRLIRKLQYAHYFLTVHDIVQFAKRVNILCQGRGSAANSAVCYVLGITSVNPAETDVLFERFISKERLEPPDIDVDFEHSRREEVMQYIYRRYGRHRAAVIATVIHYRPRSAIRDVGKALGLSEDVTASLADTVWGSWGKGLNEMQVKQAGLDPSNTMVERAIALATQLIGFPRHLSQHVGGYVLTQDRLDTYVPISNAAMDGRTFIEWDKDDVDAVKMMKVDILALGMLSCIRKCFDLIAEHKGRRYELSDIKSEDDNDVYKMLQRGESLGVFQVESRAQMNMLPRMKPHTFYDLVIEVAIVRPGPIQGDMVHPYLRRRNGEEKEIYPSPSPRFGDRDELRKILGKTLGVPLFQEQAMRIAIEAAKFTPEEANGLRRAMATFRHVGTIHTFERKMVDNMIARGYDKTFAKNCFDQIKGFGSYGFPESHAASFARLVYVSSWLKHFHPDVFACGLLNSQPMGFYAPAQIVSDASKNEVEIRPVDVSYSFGQNTLEKNGGKHHALRLGFRQIDGFEIFDVDDRLTRKNGAKGQEDYWDERIVAARNHRPFASLEDFALATRLPKKALTLLADADAFRSLGLDRRAALWAVRRLPDDVALPLFAAADAREHADEKAAPLPEMQLSEHVVADYQSIRLSIKGHPMQFLRPHYQQQGIWTCDRVSLHGQNNEFGKCAGVVLVRQRPGSAKGVVFITVEDETGIANIVVWPSVLEKYRKEVMGARLLMVEGVIQRSVEGVVHLVAKRMHDWSHDIHRLSDDLKPKRAALLPGASLAEPLNDDRREHPDNTAQRIRHPRDVRILPRSRDFH